jgi:hypothetical protein
VLPGECYDRGTVSGKIFAMNKTFKAIWFAGGGLLATWLAVTPNSTVPTPSNIAPIVSNNVRETGSDDLRMQEARLRQHAVPVPLNDSTRNPFEFGRPSKSPTGHGKRSSPAAVPPQTVSQPVLTLVGVGERRALLGATRTAVISGDGQLYVVKAGDMVAGRYRVDNIDSDAVTLRDQSGVQMRLSLRR